MERIVNTMGENPDREITTLVSLEDTTEDGIVVTEKAVRAIKPQTIILAEENCGPDVGMPDFTGFTTEPVKEKNHERNGGYGGGGGRRG